MRPDLLRHAEPLAPRRRDVIGVIPQDVGGQAGDDIGHGEAGDAPGPGPGGRRRIYRPQTALANEPEIRPLLYPPAPAHRVLLPRGAGPGYPGDPPLALEPVP